MVDAEVVVQVDVAARGVPRVEAREDVLVRSEGPGSHDDAARQRHGL